MPKKGHKAKKGIHLNLNLSQDCFIPINKDEHWYLIFLDNSVASLMQIVDLNLINLVELLYYSVEETTKTTNKIKIKL